MKQFGKIFQHGALQFSEGVATLIGSIVGAGILGLPYAINKVGFLPGMIMLVILGVFMIILELMYMEVVLRTKRDHEIPGYGSIYLGNKVGIFALGIGILTGYGTLLAYLIAQGDILSTLFGGSPTLWTWLFFAGGSYIVYRGLSAVRTIELFMTLGIFAILFLIGLHAHPHIQATNLSHVSLKNIILPYGVLLFALAGTTSVPQVRQELKGNEHRLPAVIIVANVIVIAIYALFVWLALGVTGSETTEVATIGLGKILGRNMLNLSNALAFFTISTSFITVGLSIRRLFQYDYGLPRLTAWLATIAIPAFIFALGFTNFIAVLGLVGGVIIGLQAIILIFAFKHAQESGSRKPEFTLGSLKYVSLVLIAVFIVGAVLSLS